MKRYYFIVLLLLFSITLLANGNDNDPLYEKAVELSQNILIIDTHIDIPERLSSHWEDISKRTKGGHFDYVRAKQGGLNAPFMSIYISARYQGTGKAKPLADSLINMVEGFQKKWPDKFAVAVSTDDVLSQFNAGLMSLPMGMENGAPIEGDLSNLKYFYDRGIRYITLCHSKDNLICDSSYDTTHTWNGLSPFGKKVVAEMNRLGIMIDISHVSDDTFWDVLKITKAPLIASHSSCRFFTPGFERNMSDDMIKALGKNGGVIQINFASDFISGKFRKSIRPAIKYLRSIKVSSYSPEGQAYIEKYKKENNIIHITAKDIAVNIDHAVKLAGIDHVGIGSDFDGVDMVPDDVSDASKYPNVIYELLKMNYSEEDIQKICSGNILRVWKAVENFNKK